MADPEGAGPPAAERGPLAAVGASPERSASSLEHGGRREDLGIVRLVGLIFLATAGGPFGMEDA